MLIIGKKKFVKNQTGKTVKCLRSDNGLEKSKVEDGPTYIYYSMRTTCLKHLKIFWQFRS